MSIVFVPVEGVHWPWCSFASWLHAPGKRRNPGSTIVEIRRLIENDTRLVHREHRASWPVFESRRRKTVQGRSVQEWPKLWESVLGNKTDRPNFLPRVILPSLIGAKKAPGLEVDSARSRNPSLGCGHHSQGRKSPPTLRARTYPCEEKDREIEGEE